MDLELFVSSPSLTAVLPDVSSSTLKYMLGIIAIDYLKCVEQCNKG